MRTLREAVPRGAGWRLRFRLCYRGDGVTRSRTAGLSVASPSRSILLVSFAIVTTLSWKPLPEDDLGGLASFMMLITGAFGQESFNVWWN